MVCLILKEYAYVGADTQQILKVSEKLNNF
jgi:hypothetical protein